MLGASHAVHLKATALNQLEQQRQRGDRLRHLQEMTSNVDGSLPERASV
jgi:hypothetical protein